MAADSQQRKDGLLQPGPSRPHSEAGPTVRTSTQPSIASPTLPSKEALSALYQQRQKVELRRLLKHTHPELRSLESLDGVVDQELAEVLRLETQPMAGETGYEGEVLSRRWIFENCVQSNTVDPHTSKMHMAEGAGVGVGVGAGVGVGVGVGAGVGAGVWGDVKRTPALFEQPWYNQNLQEDMVKGTTDQVERTDAAHECEEEEMVRLDVQSARRLFESQQFDTLRASQEDVTLNKVIVSEDERGAVQKRKQAFEMRSSKTEALGVNSADTEPEVSKVHPQHEGFSTVKQVFERKSQCASNTDVDFETSPRSPKYQCTSLLENREINQTGKQSHLQEPKHQNTSPPPGNLASDRTVQEDMLALEANVRNRAQLFESTLFDLINHQNREEMETVAESINETLNSLCLFNAIHSHGSIIKASETGSGQLARYRLTPGLRPEIEQEKVAEGGVKNFILQLLPRETLKPQVVYLKEDAKGNVEVTMVTVPFHQVRLASNQDKEFRTANVVQLIEDILSQDSSLRKGVVIQDDGEGRAEVTVYSLYNHSEGEVERYYPSQEQRTETNVLDIKTETGEVRGGDVKSTISSLLATSQDHSAPASYKPEVKVMGNVKLFRSCIEKGDLEYLKTLQVQPAEEELPNQTDVVTGVSMEPKTHRQQQQPEDEVEQNDLDIVPVDVKKLKNIFLANQSSAQQKETKAEKTSKEKISKAIVQVQHTSVEKKETCSDSVINTSTSHSSTKQHQEEEVVRANVQAALHSLEQTSAVNVSQGDFKSAMIYRNSGKSQKGSHKKKTNVRYAPQHSEVKTGSLTEAQPAQSVAMREGQAISVKSSTVVEVQQTSVQKEDTSCDSVIKTSTSHSCITSEQEAAPCPCKTEEASCATTASEELQNPEAWRVEVQEGTEVVQRGHLKAAMKSLQSATTEEEEEEEEEEVVRGNLQAVLHSLEKTSGVNVSQGDFKAAMIYRNSGKSKFQSHEKKTDMRYAPQHSEVKTGSLTEAQTFSSVAMSEGEQVATKELRVATTNSPNPDQTTNKPATDSTLKHKSQTGSQSLAPSKKKKIPVGPKTVPSKPDLLPKPAVPPKTGQMTGSTASQSTKSEVHISDSQTVSIRTTSSISSMSSTTSSQLKESTKSQPKESTKSQLKESIKSQPKESTKNLSKESTESQPKESTKLQQKESTKTQSKESTKSQSKEEQPPRPFTIKPMSYADALCRGLQQTDCVTEAQQSRYVSERQAGSSVGTADTGAAKATQHTGDATQLNEEITLSQEGQGSEVIPLRQTSSTTEQSQGAGSQGATEDKEEKVNEDFIGFQAALQNFGGKKAAGGKSKSPVKPKRVKMTQSEENQKNTSEMNTSTSLTVTHTAVGQQASDPSQPQPCSKPENNIQASDPSQPQPCSKPENNIQASDPSQPQPCSKPENNIQASDPSQPQPCSKPENNIQASDPSQPQPCSKPENNIQEEEEENTVVMREKKAETEDERGQRLSVHMDKIMRGNVKMAMEIFDNLRKQEELKEILTWVEEVEEDTSQVDVRSLRNIFENVPDWVVAPRVKRQRKPQQTKVEEKAEISEVKRSQTLKDDTETSMSSMALVLGDLERACKEIMNLKEQTLARLMDIEEAIKKALYSVSTLKSDSDIVSLSGLFKESLQGTAGQTQGSLFKESLQGTAGQTQGSLFKESLQGTAGQTQGSLFKESLQGTAGQTQGSASNISTISTGSSSRAKTAQGKDSPSTKTQRDPGLPVIPEAEQGPGLEVPAIKSQSSPPSSPSFIQSAARQESEDRQQESADRQKSSAARQKTESSLQPPLCSACQLSPKCSPSGRPCSRSPLNQKCQVSVLKVKTVPEGSKVVGTKTVNENNEKTDAFGSKVYKVPNCGYQSARQQHLS